MSISSVDGQSEAQVEGHQVGRHDTISKDADLFWYADCGALRVWG